jgi:glycosyltransferase involved in cell wall biosynthesis
MWADRDLGFLDLLVNTPRHQLCCTFHGCPDTLAAAIHWPSRLRALGAVIVMSRVQREFFESHGVPSERIHVVLHGVDTQYFRPAEIESSPPAFEVISVGSYRRNFGLLRRVCESLVSEALVRFRIIAPETFRGEFEGLSNTTFISGLSDDALLHSYQGAACFLLTTENATANNALLEAMACGLPVVAESIGGIPEYVSTDGGFLVPPGSLAQLVAAILKLARDPALRSTMGLAARRRAAELDWSLVAKQTRRVYESLPLLS